MRTPGISLIIPAYNAERYLAEAIDSVLAQTLPPQQIIVVDDGSIDGTAKVARDYADAVTLVSQANAGTSAARNHGLALADQPLITFLDADDRYQPEKLKRQYEALLAEPDAMLCMCRGIDFDSPDYKDSARVPADTVPRFRPGQVESWLVRRVLFDRIGVFNEDERFAMSEGSELYSRIEHAGLSVLRIDDVLVERRLHASNKTRDTNSHMDGIMALMQQRIAKKREAGQ